MTGADRKASRVARVARVAAEHHVNHIGGPAGTVSCSCGRYSGLDWWLHFATELDLAFHPWLLRWAAGRIGRRLVAIGARLAQWADL